MSGDETGGESSAWHWVSDSLEDVRADPGRRRIALAAAAVLGLLAASVHWVGLAVGGALVGLVSARLRWAVVGAGGFGVFVLTAFVLTAPAMSAGELLALTPAAYVTVGSALVLPALGSLVRGVV
ncbi:hypothetical protein BRC81_00570 [Halobacteriales archaeon QS_1_68_20]|nr:MAG: hypothetical protein BRC81_00570 [Halobacteriales archaeon QS_1_68_20]